MSANPHSPVLNTALTPLFSSASACPTQIYPSFQPSYGFLGSHHPWDVVNTPINLANTILCSPESKTEGTNPSPFSSETGRSPQHVSSSPQEAPRRCTGAVIQQRSLYTISDVKTSTVRYSLDSPAVPLPRSRIPVHSLPVSPSVRRNIEQLQPKPSELPVLRLGSSQRCPLHVVNLKLGSSTNWYSPQPIVVLTLPLPKRTRQIVTFALGCNLDMSSTMMRILRVIFFRASHNRKAEETEYTIIHEYIEDDESPTSASPSYAYVDTKAPTNALQMLPPEPSWWAETSSSVCVERIWRARCKLPNIAVNWRRQSYYVVNKMNNPGDEHSPLYRAVRILPKPSNLLRIDCLRLRRRPNPRYTSNPMRLPRHHHFLVSFVVVLPQHLRIDSEG